MFRLLDVLFGCGHRHLTFPITARRGTGRTRGTYVACLDCGKEFAYDWTRMKVIFEPKRTSEPAVQPAPAGSRAA
jgi:hypothetical protein